MVVLSGAVVAHQRDVPASGLPDEAPVVAVRFRVVIAEFRAVGGDLSVHLRRRVIGRQGAGDAGIHLTLRDVVGQRGDGCSDGAVRFKFRTTLLLLSNSQVGGRSRPGRCLESRAPGRRSVHLRRRAVSRQGRGYGCVPLGGRLVSSQRRGDGCCYCRICAAIV